MILTKQSSVEMSKKKQKQPKSAVKVKTEHKVKKEESVGQKKTFFFKRVEKKPKEKKGLLLPPKDVQEFSSNWKSLLGVLNSKQTPEKTKPAQQNTETPQSSAQGNFHKATQTTDKNLNKAGHRPQKDIKKTEEVAAQNGKVPTQHKAEKRKVKDSEEGQQKQTKKKIKVEEMEEKPKEPDIWFDDVDPDDIEAALGSEAADVARKRSGVMKSEVERTEKALVKEHSFDGLTNTVAMDCEMVGVGPGGEESILARVSIVNYFGKCVYDKYVKPTEKVTDYRTPVSGIRPADIEHGEDIKTVQKEVAEILEGRILVGHALHNDLKILFLDHPKKKIRDTQKYKPFKAIAKSSRPALRVLCREVLNVKVQQGEHSSVQDAQAAMRLYTLVKTRWEAELKASRGQKKGQKSPRKPKQKSDPKKASNKDKNRT